MHIDFHHGVTYVCARLAGFNHIKAGIVAHSAQYVDDATNSGTIRFTNNFMYTRISSAHKMLDYRNTKALKNHRVWIPFHFLPGNGGKGARENPRGQSINKLVCRPDSHVARDMLALSIAAKDKAYGLHRLGITMHVYADTWAHQGFAGIDHKVNTAADIHVDGKKDIGFMDRMINFFLDSTFPLGHGTVMSYPDLPYLKWSYMPAGKKKDGDRVERDNPKAFLAAAEGLCKAMQCYIAGDPAYDAPGFSNCQNDRALIAKMLKTVKNKDGDKRHKKWLQAIEQGKFSFGSQKIAYIAKGKGSWKHKAIGTLDHVDDEDDKFIWKDSFLTSNWKLFHDALQAHRFEVLHDILPRYGIQAA